MCVARLSYRCVRDLTSVLTARFDVLLILNTNFADLIHLRGLKTHVFYENSLC